MKRNFIFSLILSLVLPFAAAAQTTYVNPQTDTKLLQQFQDAKLGLFVHWMACHTPATGDSWNIGRVTPKHTADSITLQWNPNNFDARKMVDVAVKAGCKYMVVISKHHDGFCIWPSKYSIWDTDRISARFSRDILGELEKECRRRGLLFGIYFSIADIDYCGWPHMPYDGEKPAEPRFGTPDFIDFVHNQTNELISRYHPDILWFDGFWLNGIWGTDEGKTLYDSIKKSNKHILSTRLSNTLGSDGKETFWTNGSSGDFLSIEAKTTAAPSYPWEACTSITYPVYAYEPNAKMLSPEELTAMFSRTLCGNGNLLVNIGPKPDGTMPDEQVQRLHTLTSWIEKNKAAVYGTKGGPFKQSERMGSTYNKNVIYLHIRDAKADTLSISLPEDYQVKAASVLATGESVVFNRQGTTITLSLPSANSAEIRVVALTLNKKYAFTGWL